MIKVSKNYKLGRKIGIEHIQSLAKEGKSVAFRSHNIWWQEFSMRPAAFIQNWSINLASQYEFWMVEKVE